MSYFTFFLNVCVYVMLNTGFMNFNDILMHESMCFTLSYEYKQEYMFT